MIAFSMAGISFRKAILSDVPDIVSLLADDAIGASREILQAALPASYSSAFTAIETDRNQLLAVAEDGGRIVGTLQLTFIPGLGRGGAWRGQIEAVRVASDRRGERIGEAMFAWAINECRLRGCGLVQLTTDKMRLDAHRFYERLGFNPTHIGYKLHLS